MKTVQGQVCILTGFVVRPPEEVHHWDHNKNGRPTIQTHMGAARPRPSTQQHKGQRVAGLVLTAVKKLFASTKRREITKQNAAKINAIAVRAFRTKSTFCDIHRLVAAAAIRGAGSLRPSLTGDEPALLTLANRLSEYAVKLNIPSQRRSVFAFVAATVQMLSTGHYVHGICVVPRLNFVAAHAPAELDHGALLEIQCRSVSASTRHIVDRSVNASGVVDRQVRFPFYRWPQQSLE